MKKILLIALTLGIVVAGTAVVFGQSTTPERAPLPARAIDISGPCDEAEHANDPRCTGAPRVDNSGPGSIDDDRCDDDRHDRHDEDRYDDHDDDWDDRFDDDRWDDDRDDRWDDDRWDD